MNFLRLISARSMPRIETSDVNENLNMPFVIVKDVKGNLVRMRKTTLCWYLVTRGPNISSDRPYRVRDDVKNMRKTYKGVLSWTR